MGLIVKYKDFQSAYSFAVHYDIEPLAETEINRYEKEWLIRIFGMEMYEDFVINYQTDPNYIKLFEDLTVEHWCTFMGCREFLLSRGLKTCLLGLVYFSLNKNKNFTGTSSGVKQINQDLADSIPLVNLVNMRYNESINDVNCMQAYMRKKCSEYPLFKGERFLYNINF